MAEPDGQNNAPEPTRFEQAVNLFREASQSVPDPVESISRTRRFTESAGTAFRTGGRIAAAPISKAAGAARGAVGRAGSVVSQGIQEAPTRARESITEAVTGTKAVSQVDIGRLNKSIERQIDLVEGITASPQQEINLEQLRGIQKEVKALTDPKTEANKETLATLKKLLKAEVESRDELVFAVSKSSDASDEEIKKALDELKGKSLAGEIGREAGAAASRKKDGGRGLAGVVGRAAESGTTGQALRLAGATAFGPLFAIVDDLLDVTGKVQSGIGKGFEKLSDITRGGQDQTQENLKALSRTADASLKVGSASAGAARPVPTEQAQADVEITQSLMSLESTISDKLDEVKSSIEALPGRLSGKELQESSNESREKEVNELQASNKRTFSKGLESLREQDENQFEQERLDDRDDREELTDALTAAPKKEAETRRDKTRRDKDPEKEGIIDDVLGAIVGGGIAGLGGKILGFGRKAGGKVGGAVLRGGRGIGGLAGRGIARGAGVVAATKVGQKAIQSKGIQAVVTKGSKVAGAARTGITAAKGAIAPVTGLVAGLTGRKVAKEGLEVGAKEGLKVGAKKAATKAAGKGGAKAGVKALGKGGLKSLLKKIPGISIIAGGVFAAQRLASGDVKGAGAELASGLASTVPGFGTAASVGIDAALIGRDIKKAGASKDGIASITLGRARGAAQKASREEKVEIASRVRDLGLDGDQTASLTSKIMRATPDERRQFFDSTGGQPNLPKITAPRPERRLPEPPVNPAQKTALAGPDVISPTAAQQTPAMATTTPTADHDPRKDGRTSSTDMPIMMDDLGLILISAGKI